MKAIAIIIVIINNFVWFVAWLGSLSNYSKGVVPPPTKPTIFLVILSFVLFVMNIVLLFYILREPKVEVKQRKEVNMKRFFIGLGWFVIIYIVGSFMIGVVLGAIAGSQASTPAAGAEAGRQSSIDFFHKYGLLFFLGSVIVSIVGTATGWLPFTKDDEKPTTNP